MGVVRNYISCIHMSRSEISKKNLMWWNDWIKMWWNVVVRILWHAWMRVCLHDNFDVDFILETLLEYLLE